MYNIGGVYWASNPADVWQPLVLCTVFSILCIVFIQPFNLCRNCNKIASSWYNAFCVTGFISLLYLYFENWNSWMKIIYLEFSRTWATPGINYRIYYKKQSKLQGNLCIWQIQGGAWAWWPVYALRPVCIGTMCTVLSAYWSQCVLVTVHTGNTVHTGHSAYLPQCMLFNVLYTYTV